MHQIITKLPNGPKIYQMAVIYISQNAIKYTDTFHCKALQNLHKLGYIVLKIYRLATLIGTGKMKINK
jgi:hypothetical protein